MTICFNIMSRCPVMSIPPGLAANGVPTGLFIVGRTYDDVSVFLAAAFERERPWYRTAEIIGEALSMTPIFDCRLAEIGLGEWDGLTFDQINERRPGAWERSQLDKSLFGAPGVRRTNRWWSDSQAALWS